MATLDLNSPSQVQAILAQYYHIATPLIWKLYISSMDTILHSRPDARLLAFVLQGTLFSPVLKLLHKILVEEITPNVPRTLPTALSEEYPWATVSNEVAEGFILLANRREEWIGRHKDEEASREELMIVLAREMAVIASAERHDPDEMDGLSDILTSLSQLSIDPSETPADVILREMVRLGLS
jgi:hypothetical protein